MENPKQQFFDSAKVIKKEKQKKLEIELDNLLQRCFSSVLSSSVVFSVSTNSRFDEENICYLID
jgi:hypothetical protein